MLPKNRAPIGPSFILSEFLTEYGITQTQFAQHLHWTTTKVNQLVRGKLSVTPMTAFALADAFGNSPEFWLNAQMAVDMWEAQQKHSKIPRLPQAS